MVVSTIVANRKASKSLHSFVQTKWTSIGALAVHKRHRSLILDFYERYQNDPSSITDADRVDYFRLSFQFSELALTEVLFESLPQSVLQSLISSKSLRDGSKLSLFQIVSIILSIFTLSWSFTSYARQCAYRDCLEMPPISVRNHRINY